MYPAVYRCGYKKLSDLFSELGFQLCWDNVQKLVQVRHSSLKNQNKMLMWTNALAVLNRVAARLGILDDENTLWARDIPLKSYFIDEEGREVCKKKKPDSCICVI